ncbi:homeobox protein MSX-2 [Linepithema humile]|uniref:homeobox protein MSX-2 n=1 Tax=Linepithema humile TaxID=83485 RepID=UPI00351E0765
MMTSGEARGSRMRNTDFSIARILADDRCSKARTAAERDVRDVARKRPRYTFPDQERNEERIPRHDEGRRMEYVNRGVSSETCQDISVAAERNGDNNNESAMRRTDLTWLQYTRYRPPKLPRRSFVEKRIKRRTGDHPRIPFSSSQLQVLEDRYRKSAYLSRNDVIEMSATLRLPQSKIKIWFQNRRARQRRELLNSTIVTT